MNVVREIQRLNEKELQRGTAGMEGSWHGQYKDSAWVFVGSLPLQLSEGDVLCVMSQWGEIEDLHLVRDKGTGKSKGFAFLKYEDQRSTILAVDNMNGIKLLERTLRVDHKEKYSLPKEVLEKAEEKEKARLEAGEDGGGGEPRWKPGHAYEGKELVGGHDLSKGVDLFALAQEGEVDAEEDGLVSSGNEEEDAWLDDREEKLRRREKKRRKKEEKREKKERKMRKGEEKETKGWDWARGDTEEGGDGRQKRRQRSSSPGSEREGFLSKTQHEGNMREREREREEPHGPWRGEGDRWMRGREGEGEGAGEGEDAFEGKRVSQAPRMALPAGHGFPSWRGRYDPAVQEVQGRGGGAGGRGGRGGRGFDTGGAGARSMFGQGLRRGGGGKSRGAMTGIGGMHRRR